MNEHTKASLLAFTIGEFIIFIGAAAFLGLLLWQNRLVSHHGSPANDCINNLRQLDAAANQFALEHHLTNGDRINFPADLTPYIKLNSLGNIPPCPMGGTYHLARVGKTPTCTLSTAKPAHVLP